VSTLVYIVNWNQLTKLFFWWHKELNTCPHQRKRLTPPLDQWHTDYSMILWDILSSNLDANTVFPSVHILYIKHYFLHQCALSVTNLTPSCRRQPDWWRQVAYTGTKLLYQPEPKPVVYIVPVHHILGRLALVPYGAHGTIPYDWHQLQLSHYRRGACVITVKGQAVGANSSTSTPGPWYGHQTIPVTLKRHNVHRGVLLDTSVHTG